jgi:anti-anti-sigma factor
MTLNTNPFEAIVRDSVGTDLAIIDLTGDIDDQAKEQIGHAYTEASAREPSRLLLNFAGVNYINSIGIALIVGVLARARQERIEVIATGLSEHYREIFEITSLSDFMTIVSDERALSQTPPRLRRDEDQR